MNRTPILPSAAIRLLLFSTMLALGIAPAHAADRYVRSGASGSGSGSDWTNAWNAFARIDWSLVGPGDTIHIAAGTYGSVTVPKSGTAGSPLVLRRATVAAHGTAAGWNDSYDGRVIIDGGIVLGGSVAGDHVTIDGATTYGIWVINALHGIRTLGPNGSANGLTLRYLELGDAGAGKMDEDGIQGSGNDLLLEYCYIHDNDNVSTHGDGIQWYSGRNLTMRYNIWKNNGQMMMLTETVWGNSYVDNLHVYYNVFYNRSGAHYNGISKKLSPQPGYYWRVYNNTFDLGADDNSGYDNLFSGAGSSTQMDFRNNAVIRSHASSLGGVSHSYNGFDNAGADLVYAIPSSETGRVVAADLGFVNAGAADYRLTAASPLIGKGINVGLTRDFAGNPVSSTPCIGAFEYGTSADTSAPTTPTGLVASAVSSSRIDLAWSASTDNVGVVGYRIQRGGTLIATAIGTSYSATGLAAGTAYSFTVSATDAAGNASAPSASASAVTLSASAAPTITAQPQSRSVVVGQTATFTATATGNPTPTYQWQKNNLAIGGATTPTYTTPVTTLADNGATFRVVVSNSSGIATSSPATLTVAASNQNPVVSAATATPAAVTATTTSLAAIATDDGGEAGLIYTWSASGPAAVGFSANGGNAAKTSTATFSKAGSYTLTVTAKDAGNLTGTRSVPVTVNATPTLSISPTGASVQPGMTVDFNAVATDQFQVALATQPSVGWTVSGGGTINANGLFTAGTGTPSPTGGVSATTYVVTASAGSVSSTALVTVSTASTASAGGTGGGPRCGGGSALALIGGLGLMLVRRRRR